MTLLHFLSLAIHALMVAMLWRGWHLGLPLWWVPGVSIAASLAASACGRMGESRIMWRLGSLMLHLATLGLLASAGIALWWRLS